MNREGLREHLDGLRRELAGAKARAGKVRADWSEARRRAAELRAGGRHLEAAHCDEWAEAHRAGLTTADARVAGLAAAVRLAEDELKGS